MRYSATTLSRLRTTTVLVFVVGILTILGVLFVKFGGNIPGLTNTGYRFHAQFQNIQNLVTDGDVEMAGVPVGKVEGITHQGNHELVTMVLHRNAPIHQGAKVQIRAKTLLNETYVQITDGTGAPVKSGGTLPLGAVKNDTTLNDVLNALNPTARAQAGALISELQQATAGQGGNLNQILGGLGDIGRNGQTVFDILANQNVDLQQLVKQTATLMAVLDEGQGQIAQLVTSAQQVNRTTAAARASVAGTIQALPGLMQSIQGSASSVQTLSQTLLPISANLQRAAPELNHDLVVLPSITTQLRQLNPTLESMLQVAPATLGPLPTTAGDLDQLNPSFAYTLSDLDPSVAYLAPYKADIASFISNFGATAAHQDCATCATYTETEVNVNANSTEPSTLQPPISVNANPSPGQINGVHSSPQPPPPNYTDVQRLKY
jgi:phospholipid/cholesterol/gamma-HCH transport system substrate-binding protein